MEIDKVKSIAQSFFRSSSYKTMYIVLVATFFVVGISYIQAAFTFPTADPPSGNVPAPVNLSNVFQDKSGGFEANTIAVTNGFSLNGVNRLSASGWPTSGATTTTATCHLEVRRVDTTTKRFYDASGAQITAGQYPKCDDYLSTEAKADGWAHSGGDNCTTVISSDCGGVGGVPSACVYTRMVCDSALSMSPPVTSTSTYISSPINVVTIASTTIPL